MLYVLITSLPRHRPFANLLAASGLVCSTVLGGQLWAPFVACRRSFGCAVGRQLSLFVGSLARLLDRRSSVRSVVRGRPPLDRWLSRSIACARRSTSSLNNLLGGLEPPWTLAAGRSVAPSVCRRRSCKIGLCIRSVFSNFKVDFVYCRVLGETEVHLSVSCLLDVHHFAGPSGP